MRFIFQLYYHILGIQFTIRLLITNKEDTKTYSHAKFIAF